MAEQGPEGMSYKELQNAAMLLDLPANLKQPLLLRIIRARRDGREDIVSDIVDKYRDYRWQRRTASKTPDVAKRPGVRGRPRKTAARPATTLHEPYNIPEVPYNRDCPRPKSRSLETSNAGKNLLRALLVTPSTFAVTSRNSITPRPTSHPPPPPPPPPPPSPPPPLPPPLTPRPQYLRESNNVITITNPQLPRSFYEMLSEGQRSHTVTTDTYQGYHQETMSYSRSGWQSSQDYQHPIPGPEPENFMTNNTEQLQHTAPAAPVQAHDLTVRKFSSTQVFMQNCDGQTFHPVPPPPPSPVLPPPPPPTPSAFQLPRSALAHSLEYFLNYKAKYLTKQPILTVPAVRRKSCGVTTTEPTFFYTAPICAIVLMPFATSESTSSDLLQSEPEGREESPLFPDTIPNLETDTPLPPLFPEFRGQNNQLSYPMIYQYLVAAEQQFLNEKGNTMAQPRQSDGSSVVNLGPQATSSPSVPHCHHQLRSQQLQQQQTKYHQHHQQQLQAKQHYQMQLKNQQQLQFRQQMQAHQQMQAQQQLQTQHHQQQLLKSQQHHQQQLQTQQHLGMNGVGGPPVSEDPLTINSHPEESEVHFKPCVFYNNGCPKSLPDSLVSQHERNCQFQTLRCPLNVCQWNGRLKSLSSHVRESHRSEIIAGSEQRHSFPVHKLRAQQSLHFLQEARRHLFVLSIHCQGNTMYATIQFIPPPFRSNKVPKTVFSAKGSLEVVGVNGLRRGWAGAVLPVQDRTHALWATGHCLAVDVTDLGFIAGSDVTIHVRLSS